MRSSRSSPGLSGDALYDMTMQRIDELRTDAAHGREYRRTDAAAHSDAAETVQTTESVDTTSSTIGLGPARPSLARPNR